MANPIMVKAWFKKAIDDYQSAKALYDLNTEGHLLNSSYLTQQSIEKSLKGFLTFCSIRFNKTHKLVVLLDLLKPIESTPKYIFDQREMFLTLSDWSLSVRYPDAVVKTVEPPTKENMQPALEFALKCFLDLSKLSQIHPE